MELVQLDGRSWRVTAVRHIGYAPFTWRYGGLFSATPLVEHDYEPGPALSADEVRARVLAHVEANPDIFCHFSDDAEELEARMAEVRPLSSIQALYEWLKPSYFDL